MTITLDSAVLGLVVLLFGNLCAGIWYLSKQHQITKTHEGLHGEHKKGIKDLDVTQREHGKIIAVHSNLLGVSRE